MEITINQLLFDLAEGATVQDALDSFGAKLPFAVALNYNVIHRRDYPNVQLKAGDALEIVQPVAGG
jgi:sulfur carrier protein